MATQHDRFRDRLQTRHDGLFDGERYTAEFYNYVSGVYDPDTGTVTDERREQIAALNIEIVPPGMDSTVDVDGTRSSWDTSIRFPESQGSKTFTADTTIPSGETRTFDSVTVESGATLTVNGTLITGEFDNNGAVQNNNTVIVLRGDSLLAELTPLGIDNERPTEIEINDPTDNDPETYELHSFAPEQGSGMLMCRVVEQ